MTTRRCPFCAGWDDSSSNCGHTIVQLHPFHTPFLAPAHYMTRAYTAAWEIGQRAADAMYRESGNPYDGRDDRARVIRDRAVTTRGGHE